MEALKKLCENIISLDVDVLLSRIYERPEFKQLVGELNLQDQLFKQGIDSLGNSLGEYAESTKKVKRAKGLPSDRITLFQTGEFYATYDVIPDIDGFWIVADGRKGDSDLFIRYGNDILGFTPDNFEPLKDIILDELVKLIQEEVTKGI